jgi:hypothetical protein
MEPKMKLVNLHTSLGKTLFLSFIFFVGFLSSCEEPYTPSTSELEQEIVVEGYVEAGTGANPVIVIITKSIPFLSEVGPEKFSELFVKGASVSVFDGDKTVSLIPLCLNDLPEEIKKAVAEALNLDPQNLTADICIYADILNQITREEGRRYDLTVEVENKKLTATTTIPYHVPLDTFVWMDPPGDPNDTLARLTVSFQDAPGVTNYYRYFTAEVGSGLIAPFSSVVEDVLFDGKKFEFPLQKAERRGGDFTPETFGLYKRGTTAVIKWCSIDKEHFDFWNTRDFAANSGGPFSTYTRISTNIKGGLGIWGGYAVSTDTIPVPVK